VGWASAVLL